MSNRRPFGGEWSPDGTRIVFYSDRRLPTPWHGYEPYELYTVHPDGKGLVRILTVTPTVTGGTDCDTFPDQAKEPRWSPDGQKIAFQREATHGASMTTRMCRSWDGSINPDGSGYTTLVPGGWPDFEIEGPPIWSPDSAHVTYAASGATFVVDTAGGPEGC